jgi:cadmium resistance protein CadD (predicted permease)
MVCLRNISVDSLHKGDTEDNDDDNDDDDNNNNNNNNVYFVVNVYCASNMENIKSMDTFVNCRLTQPTQLNVVGKLAALASSF